MMQKRLTLWRRLLPCFAAACVLAVAACHSSPAQTDRPRPAGQQAHVEQAGTAQEGGKRNGLMLDIARRFYPVGVIKSYIDTLARSGGSFLHLHLSDNENYALESRLLNQLAADARFSDGLYTNPKTGKPFLSDAQLREITEYAQKKGIEIVPEIDSPAHMKGVFALLRRTKGEVYVRSLKSESADDEIDITRPQSIAFVESLMSEAAAKFPYARRLHIGADEFGYSARDNHEFVAYANRLANFLSEKGLKMQMWNDGVIRQNLKTLNRNIEITYWSYDGDAENKAVRDSRRRMRAAMPELIAAGFSVWNYNSYYLYFVPKPNLASSGDSAYAARDVERNWDLGIWDGKNADNALNAADSEKVRGAALAVWGEEAESLGSQTIFAHTEDLLKAVLHKANAKPSR